MAFKDVQADLSLWKRILYIFHLIITGLAWLAPFLVSWYIIIPVYLLVVIQFMIFGRCLLNDAHDLHDDGEETIYSHVLESLNIAVDKKRLRFYVRYVFYILLSTIAIVWQLILGFQPLLF